MQPSACDALHIRGRNTAVPAADYAVLFTVFVAQDRSRIPKKPPAN